VKLAKLDPRRGGLIVASPVKGLDRTPGSPHAGARGAHRQVRVRRAVHDPANVTDLPTSHRRRACILEIFSIAFT
jgi:hypothetical protein